MHVSFRETKLNANWRRNHNFRVGHNWQNRQTNLGYTWKFGKRRRSIDIEDKVLEMLKMESKVIYALIRIINC